MVDILHGIATGLELLLKILGENGPLLGLLDLFGVSGGVPLPLALVSEGCFEGSFIIDCTSADSLWNTNHYNFCD